jgi:hypothetical protein
MAPNVFAKIPKRVIKPLLDTLVVAWVVVVLLLAESFDARGGSLVY